MTPKEKIEFVKREIGEKTEISPKGPITIRLYSIDEYEDGPTLLTKNEQKLIIKKLEEDGYIKDVQFRYDGSIIYVDLEKIDDKTNTEREFIERLFLLKVFYSKLLEICDAFAGSGLVAIRDTALNHCYTILASFVEDILEREEFAEFKAEKPELFESLIGDISDYDIEWEYGSKPAFNFLAKIEKRFILSGAPTFELPKEYTAFFEKINEVIINHKKSKAETWQSIEKSVDGNKEKLSLDKDQKEEKTIKIEIVNDLVIKGLENSLRAIIDNKKEADVLKFPYKLPAGTVWENITWQFLNDYDVFIKVGRHQLNTDYKKLELLGKGKNPNPSVLWDFLKMLSIKNCEIKVEDAENNKKYKKQKELLSTFLKEYFSIDLDPFFPYQAYPPYKHESSYKIRIKLIPTQSMLDKKQILEKEINKEILGEADEGDKKKEYLDFYKEQTSQT